MKIAILHNAVAADAAPDDADVLVQAAAVGEALTTLGHEWRTLSCALDLDHVAADLRTQPPDLVFNLVESLGGYGRLIAHVPALLDALGIPYTGAPAEAMLITSNKLLGKAWLATAGLPVPPTAAAHPPCLAHLARVGDAPDGDPQLWVVKSVWEHASIGLDEDTLVAGAAPGPDVLAARALALGGDCFAEPFVEGREFNISVLAGGPDGPEVLPPAEIDFGDFPPDKPRLVGYRAKWDEASFEYHHTPRRFDFPPADHALIRLLCDLALEAWRALGLRGYARVDFRVDPAGQPFILEVNTNPCISPDAGFAAAATRAGLGYPAVVSRILDDVLTAPGRRPTP